MIRPINKIIIQLIDVEEVDALIEDHIKKGMAEVGFHYMIEQNGSIRIGRSINTIGNHYIGENSNSIGIALIGKTLTDIHESSINTLIKELSIKGVDTKNISISENGTLKKYR